MKKLILPILIISASVTAHAAQKPRTSALPSYDVEARYLAQKAKAEAEKRAAEFNRKAKEAQEKTAAFLSQRKIRKYMREEPKAARKQFGSAAEEANKAVAAARKKAAAGEVKTAALVQSPTTSKGVVGKQVGQPAQQATAHVAAPVATDSVSDTPSGPRRFAPVQNPYSSDYMTPSPGGSTAGGQGNQNNPYQEARNNSDNDFARTSGRLNSEPSSLRNQNLGSRMDPELREQLSGNMRPIPSSYVSNRRSYPRSAVGKAPGLRHRKSDDYDHVDIPEQEIADLTGRVKTSAGACATKPTGRNKEDQALVCNCFFEAEDKKGDIAGKVEVNRSAFTRQAMNRAVEFGSGTIDDIIWHQTKGKARRSKRRGKGRTTMTASFSWTKQSMRYRAMDANPDKLKECVKAVAIAKKEGPNGLPLYHANYVSPPWDRRKVSRNLVESVHIFYRYDDSLSYCTNTCPGLNNAPQNYVAVNPPGGVGTAR